MEKNKLPLAEELENLTNEKASNFFLPSMFGQVKVKGKFVRDLDGKLVPVLVKNTRKKPDFKIGKCMRPERKENTSVLGSIKKIFYKVLRIGDKST